MPFVGFVYPMGCCGIPPPPISLYTKQTVQLILTPWSRVLPKKLTVPRLVKKFPAFYGTRMLIIALTKARHLSLSQSRSIQSMTPILLLEDPF